MRWFEGSIPAAIATSKQHSSVFVVVIAGDDEQSTQMLSSWEDERVAELTNNCFIAIKVDAKSETCVQFSQIYPVVCIPSSFFIGDNGIPLEIIAGGVSAEELINRIKKVKQIHTQQTSAPVQPVSETSLQAESPSTSESHSVDSDIATGNPSTAATSKESLSMHMEEAGASGHVTPGDDRSQSSDDTSPASQAEEPLDTKVERLTKKLEERREQKRKGEEENEIKKEIERRKLGKEVLDFKRKQEEEKTKRMLEERNREKAEEKAARERVKQQIAQEVGNRFGHFSLATMFPRREFTAEDLEKTLLELELAPSASIVLLPQSGRPANTVVQSSSTGGIWAFLGTILYPLLAVWRFLSGVLFGSPPPGATAAPRNQPQRPSNSLNASSGEPKRETIRKRVLEKRPEDFKKDGKIYRLRTQEDSEDDNNTWNGNSTQQM
ncbi:UBX domain-containing protein 4 isoform X3 [Neoarius graeffei]|uniref:UBX domain-containing protein 4 isoform X3 n=1 Tax=Neoarius graeffei TaxID=443677 RepID=UPI00298C1FBE|nr:UBX domain-containing protein 4 isoform X3 [Neoarius graeffei]